MFSPLISATQPFLRQTLFSLGAAFGFCVLMPVHAQDAVNAAQPDTLRIPGARAIQNPDGQVSAAELSAADTGSYLADAQNHIASIWNQGSDAVYLSGWAHHGRSTYSHEKLNQLNEKAWGFGYGKTLRNDQGNDESLYLFALKDSHRHPQYMAGYAYEWNWKPFSQFEIGAGYTTMLMSRQDILDSVPFPVVLPLVSLGPKKAKILMSYVPRLSKNKNNGDVLLVFTRFTF